MLQGNSKDILSIDTQLGASNSCSKLYWKGACLTPLLCIHVDLNLRLPDISDFET